MRDARHDRRAQAARDRMFAPLRDCADSLDGFAEAIAGDEQASARFNRGVERLGRTLSILFGDFDSSPRALLERWRRRAMR